MPATMVNGVLTPEPRFRNDHDLIQGVWETVAGPKQVRLLVEGDHFAFEFADGDLFFGTFELAPFSQPSQMELKVLEGPRRRGQNVMCIYRMDGDVLHWCPTPVDAQRPLTQFPNVDDDRYLSLVFKHVRRPRRS